MEWLKIIFFQRDIHPLTTIFRLIDYSFLGTANLADISADAISSTKAGPFVTSVGQTGDGTV